MALPSLSLAPPDQRRSDRPTVRPTPVDAAEPLAPAFLRQVLAGLAAAPALWDAALKFEAAGVRRTLLIASESYEVWLECWLPGHDEVVEPAVAATTHILRTLDGTLVAGRPADPALGRPLLGRPVPAGEHHVLSPRRPSRVRNESTSPAVALRGISPGPGAVLVIAPDGTATPFVDHREPASDPTDGLFAEPTAARLPNRVASMASHPSRPLVQR